MHIVTVYPLAKGARAQTLHYYYSQPINRGTLVTVPFGKREVTAVVADCTPAEDKKLEIRSADYELKPITIAHKQIFFTQFLNACEQFARFSGVTTGSVIRALTPATLRNNLNEVPDIITDFLQPDISAPPASIIQDTYTTQLEYIHSLIRSQQSQGHSTFLCAPTINDCKSFAKQIDFDHTVQLHSNLTKAQTISNWNEVVNGNQPLVIIGTPTFLGVPRADLGQTIVTSESNSAYKMNSRPFLDKAIFARQLANNYKQSCILADRALSTEALWEFENNHVTPQYDPVFQYHGEVTTNLVDMTNLADTNDTGVRVFSPDLADMLRDATQENKQVLLFVARSGRRPFTACRDCGETVTCPQCDLPLLLVEQNDERLFVCRTCKQQFSTQIRCDNCNSWHLQPLGIGTDFVVEILKAQLEAPVYQIDGDSTSSEDQVENTLEAFWADPGGILVTTTLGINYLDQSVNSSGVVTADSLLAVPDLSISHKLFKLLLTIREYTDENMLIQTRSNQADIFKQALNGDIDSFYTDQITQREQFGYPPFSYLIKLQVNESKKRQQELLETVKQDLNDYELQIYPDRSSTGRNILIRITRDNWVNEQLLSTLRSLPLAVSVNAHPRSLL